ncbi:MAG TPA: S41 family peptidase [Flavisolibacter sp.]|nr:S41 family peptidase [Flavisolibacter sp.]
MKKYFQFAILSITALVCSTRINAQMPDSVKNYIDTAIHILQTRSLFGKDLDWKKIRDTAYLKAQNATSYKEAFPAISYAFLQLNDYHGMVANRDTFVRIPSPIDFEKSLSAGLKKEAAKGPRIVTAWLDQSVAYLRVPTMIVHRQEAMDELANKLRDSLCMLLAKNPKSLVLDLRLNNGGNAAPMQSGLGPLFHFSVLGYGVDRDNQFLPPVQMKDGVVLDEKGNKMVAVKNTCTASKNLPIAVLIGLSTVSSAEITAAFLKPQPNVKLFGEATPGFCGATEGFLFGNQQGYLLFSVNRIADSKKHIYQDLVVRPDVYVKSDDNFDDLTADPTVKEALSWLNTQKNK